MNHENVLQELEDRFKVDPLSIYSRTADLICLQQEICSKLFRSLNNIFPKIELLLSDSEQMIVQESLASYEMLNTFFGGVNE